MKIHKWVHGLSVSENIKLNIQINTMNNNLVYNDFHDVLGDSTSFEFKDYIKNEYNNKFPPGIGQKLGCKLHNFITGI